MAEVNRETVTTRENLNGVNSVAPQAVEHKTSTTTVKNSYTAQNLVYFLFGVLEFLLIFRFIFKATGANPGSGFVSFIYGLTGLFVLPFSGIFRTAVAQGAEVSAVFEPATLVAIAVYSLLAWGIVKLIAIMSNEPEV